MITPRDATKAWATWALPTNARPHPMVPAAAARKLYRFGRRDGGESLCARGNAQEYTDHLDDLLRQNAHRLKIMRAGGR